MESYSPIFSKIVDSSIWEEPDFVVKVFITLLAKKNADHVVRGSAFNISRWAKKTEAEAIEALKILSLPDTRRLEPQPYEGRRIMKVEDGWLVLNGQAYEDEAKKIAERVRKARWARENRAKGKGKPLAGELSHINAADAGASDAQLDNIAALRRP